MNLAPSNVLLPFEVTYDRDDLYVGMSVYNVTGVSPVLVAGPTLMTHLHSNTYFGKFGGEDGKSYVITKAVYTSSALTTLDTNYSEASESIFTQVIGGSGGGGGGSNLTLIGYILNNNELLGLIEC